MTDTGTGKVAGADRSAESTRDVAVFAPPTDIYETKDVLVLTLEMPGVEADAVNVTLEKRELTITGRCQPFVPEGYALSRAEYRDGDFERSFTLSEVIDGGGISASMKDGVLRLTLPKVKPAPAKTINVTAG